MSDLAFWRSNPFKSSSAATATGFPERPSALASRQGVPGAGAGYTGATTAPPYLGTTAPNALGSYPTTQQPYPSASPAPASNYSSMGTGGSSYTTPQVGAYGQGRSAAPAGTSSYVNTSPYSGTAYSGTAATPYGSLAESPNTNSGSYTPANTTGPYANSQSSSAADRYANRFNRFNERFDRPNTAANPYASGTASLPPPTSQSNGTANPYGAGTSGSALGGEMASPYATGSQYSSTSPYRGNPLSSSPRTAVESAAGQGIGSTTPNSYLPPSAASYQQPYPSAADPIGASPGSGYTSPASSYTPGATGYTPPGVSPYRSPASSYTPPAGSYTPPASNSAAPPPYRPGSTTNYLPSTPSVTTPGSAPSAYPSAAPDIGTYVRPTGYTRPTGTLR